MGEGRSRCIVEASDDAILREVDDAGMRTASHRLGVLLCRGHLKEEPHVLSSLPCSAPQSAQKGRKGKGEESLGLPTCFFSFQRGAWNARKSNHHVASSTPTIAPSRLAVLEGKGKGRTKDRPPIVSLFPRISERAVATLSPSSWAVFKGRGVRVLSSENGMEGGRPAGENEARTNRRRETRRRGGHGYCQLGRAPLFPELCEEERRTRRRRRRHAPLCMALLMLWRLRLRTVDEPPP